MPSRAPGCQLDARSALSPTSSSSASTAALPEPGQRRQEVVGALDRGHAPEPAHDERIGRYLTSPNVRRVAVNCDPRLEPRRMTNFFSGATPSATSRRVPPGHGARDEPVLVVRARAVSIIARNSSVPARPK